MDPWWDRLYTFLDSYGREIWYLRLELEAVELLKLADFIYFKLFQAVPHLKMLCIVGQSIPRLDMDLLPAARNLETVEVSDSDSVSNNHDPLSVLIKKYGNQLRKLRVCADDELRYYVYGMPLPNIQELVLDMGNPMWWLGMGNGKISPDIIDYWLEFRMPNLNMLQIIFPYEQDYDYALEDLLKVINKLTTSTRLTTLRLVGSLCHLRNASEDELQRITSDCRQFSLQPSTLKTLEIDFCWETCKRGNGKVIAPNYNFVVRCFPHLENFTIFNRNWPGECEYWQQTEINLLPLAECTEAEAELNTEEEVLELHKYMCRGDMYKSNVWQLLPRLRVFTYQWMVFTREGYEAHSRKGEPLQAAMSQELRRRRTDQSVELQKARIDEQLSKRRNIDTDELDNPSSQAPAGAAVNDATLRQIVMDMFGTDPDKQFAATQLTRKILSRERHPPIDIVIQAGIVPRCIEFLRDEKNPDLQFEAAWVLTNIASGNQSQTNTVVEAGAVEPFIDMLRSPFAHIAEQAIWALGNIAGDGTSLRDFVISKGIVPPLVALAKSSNSPAFLRNVAWTLSNLCRAKSPPPPQEATRMCLPALARLIKMQDMEVVSDACWALSYLSDGTNEKIEEVVKSGVVQKLVELLDCDNYSVITPCLRAVGNIVTGTDTQKQCVVKAGVLPILKKLLTSPKGNIVKEAAWTVSNIAAGTVDQIGEILDAGLVPLLVAVLRSGEFRAQKEVVWAITNITSGGNVDHMIFLCQSGAVPAMCQMLKCPDWRTILTTLDGLENILKAAEEVGQVIKVACSVHECGGHNLIQQLQNQENNEEVYNKASSIIDLPIFSSDDFRMPMMITNLLPSTNAQGDFQMSVSNIPDGGFNI